MNSIEITPELVRAVIAAVAVMDHDAGSALLDALVKASERRDFTAPEKDVRAEAALDRVRDLLDRHKSAEIHIDDVHAALDGAQ